METTSYNETIAQQLAGLSPAKRALLELRLMKKRPAGAAKRLIPRRADGEPAPLSYNQQGFWVLNQLMPGASLYHTPVSARLKGGLDVTAIRKALNFIVARHDALRTSFTTVDGRKGGKPVLTYVLSTTASVIMSLSSPGTSPGGTK